MYEGSIDVGEKTVKVSKGKSQVDEADSVLIYRGSM
jgi:hypothetical protein